MKNERDVVPWGAGGRSASRKIDEAGRRHLTLTLEEDQPFRERGYNPYETVAHMRGARPDVWRNKPKRS